ncbi:MAG TPA: HAMP domain-containing sensor histidine kinase [Anaerolineae bacterium]|nr:HAMP domain-containing sensor histidine kinase [Anaerolineae bacterium]HQK14579.1 HAMP domain-containing sensor histidine kinase [Anaerolineae bacterium]
MRSLRGRLILSHVIPLIIVIPLVGVALTYLLETQVLLASSSKELELQAALVAAAAAQNPQIWYNPVQAAAFVSQVGGRLSARMMMLSADGQLLATNDPAYRDQLGEVLDVPGLRETVLTRQGLRVDYGERPGTGAAEVLMPVVGPTFDVIGVIRLTDPLSNVYARFPRTRTLILWVLAGGMLIGVIVGWVLAVDLARPLRRATQAISQMAEGHSLSALPEQGPNEVRMLLRAFNALTAQRHELEKSRKRLLANLVHELGRPLGALLSATQALAGGAAQDVALRAELLEGMEGQIRLMRRLLDDLTQLYDQALGPLELARKPVALAPWLTQELATWREAAQDKGLRWQANIPDDLPELSLDADRIGQALGNVVSNAVKYTPSGGEVAISAGTDEGGVWIRVQDTGVGIPPEEQARIFEPFYRGPSSRRFPQGMGLGLSIARDLVVAHGGRIEVESTPGVGSAFTLWLPRIVDYSQN